MTEDIIEAKTTDQLSDLLCAYCKANDLAFESADEVLLEALGRMAEAKNHADWLIMFCAQWNAVQAREDAAECRRNGHRDSGRGQCIDCDEFI
jgi:hypothetical protein